ncbi:MAG: L,D-transpeptidase [Hoeflea sp.]|uniref:L,D-transpeptidase n=1 Tax=Hoeflea sp. TaxID=1940281 RepID=UPI001DEC8391|nr:L,D-transpeptidase [Hoeflea sp.]MBU4530540.1 L,D-transpeptidase [Alphaproteobacteria bacterium]MBU4545327.1 L,D-transpeptidase [Alphaproteobacteria bacterium]MBU4548976.1 L,D-transpeptidase [Alphaproteobacteria bacterium]MBV1722131.1 L,D-transpeptidase [Hoeflea sp.]MBV1761481.1 L,D-transpeptidase [Hoeflea sp.]
MKRLISSAFLALCLMAPAAVQAQPAGQTSSESKSLMQILFPPSDTFSKHSRSDKSPIKRKVISFTENHPVGTIIIDTSDRRLYHVIAPGKATAYGIGVGREGFTWQGKNKITRKAEWPGWTPPQVMRDRVKRQEGRILPAHMKGGPDNPLGARALYIGSTIYRIHGTNQPWTIGQAMSSGCIRMANEDVIDLYNKTKVGAQVIVRK